MIDDFDGALRWMSSDRDCLRGGHTCPPCLLMIDLDDTHDDDYLIMNLEP